MSEDRQSMRNAVARVIASLRVTDVMSIVTRAEEAEAFVDRVVDAVLGEVAPVARLLGQMLAAGEARVDQVDLDIPGPSYRLRPGERADRFERVRVGDDGGDVTIKVRCLRKWAELAQAARRDMEGR